jgi:transposase-like protein
LCESEAPSWGREDYTTMKQRRHSPEQIIRLLQEGEKLLGQGQNIEEVARHLEITESTWHRWRNQYGGMKADDAKRLKELEKEGLLPVSWVSWPKVVTERCRLDPA